MIGIGSRRAALPPSFRVAVPSECRLAALTAPTRTGLGRPRGWWAHGLSDDVDLAVRLLLSLRRLALILHHIVYPSYLSSSSRSAQGKNSEVVSRAN